MTLLEKIYISDHHTISRPNGTELGYHPGQEENSSDTGTERNLLRIAASHENEFVRFQPSTSRVGGVSYGSIEPLRNQDMDILCKQQLMPCS